MKQSCFHFFILTILSILFESSSNLFFFLLTSVEIKSDNSARFFTARSSSSKATGAIPGWQSLRIDGSSGAQACCWR
jgi:hypothetical protein